MAAPTRVLPVLIQCDATRIMPVAASTKIYKGWMVSVDAGGDLVEATDTAGESFAGVALNTVDNSSGADGDVDVRICTRGRIIVQDNGTTLSDGMGQGLGQSAYIEDGDKVGAAGDQTNDVYAGFVTAFENVEDPLSRSPAIIIDFGRDNKD